MVYYTIVSTLTKPSLSAKQPCLALEKNVNKTPKRFSILEFGYLSFFLSDLILSQPSTVVSSTIYNLNLYFRLFGVFF